MIPELGQFALALALCVALAQALLPAWGVARHRPALAALAVPAARLQLALVALAWVALAACFVRHDFSVALVAQHSNTGQPLPYRLAATWGNHEGSILLWTLILAGWGAAVSLASRALDAALRARVLAVIGAVGAGFLLFTLAASNPFARLLPAAAEGRELNPLLQDPGMVLHPPLLYMGYVGLVVAYAFVVAALLAGRMDAAWARWARPWTLAAWCFLTLGIALGSFWAYYELGWGGWWFWDPVENASLMPWLLATALLHVLSVTANRGALQAWTALLALLAFGLSLLGTFIVRSGVLSSVHAFATDPSRGLAILAFLVVAVGGALALYAARVHRLDDERRFEPLSREALLLAGSLVLAVVAGCVLLGTLYPLAVDALGLGKLSVGPPWFNAVVVPLAVPALALMAVAPAVRWGGMPARMLAGRLHLPLAGAAAGAAVPLVLPQAGWLTGLGLALAGAIAAGSLAHLARRLREGGLRRSEAGMALAHAGMAVFLAGVSAVGGLQHEGEVRLAPGGSATLGGLRWELASLATVEGPNWLALEATLVVRREDGSTAAVLRPQKRRYTASRMAMTEVAIDRSIVGDLYAALGEPLDGGAWSLRLQVKPLVDWIWAGCLLMALGGAVAACDRGARRRSAAATPAGAAVGAP